MVQNNSIHTAVKRTAIFATLMGAAVASHATLTLDFNTVVTGGTPGGTTPWATLVIQDTGLNTVDLTLTHNSSSAAGQFITELLLSLTAIPGDLTVTGTLSPKVNSISWGPNAFNDSGYLFDLDIIFVTSNANGGLNRLKPGESVTISLFGTGLDETDFSALAFPVSGGSGLEGMVHIQGIEGGLSSKVTTPEPASMAALGLGALALMRRRRGK